MADDVAPVISLEKVHKRFGDVVAVHEVDIRIAPGEFFSLLGPSGCGKTTTLRMIAGFEQPTEGVIRLDGADVSSVPPYRRNINTVFQQYALFPHLSVADNVAFGPRSLKVTKREVASRVDELLRVVRLDGLERRKPSQLSGGQQQRVALARALASYPSALLLDEPLGALDLKLRQAMQLELKRIQREVGIAFIYVTHDQWEALTMSDRIAVMNHGRVEQIATPAEIYDDPRSVFVAGFIGDGNLIDVELGPGADGAVEVEVLGARMPARTNQVIDTNEATLLIRPDRIAVGSDRPERPAVEVTVTGMMFQGSTVRLDGVGRGGEPVFAHPGRFAPGEAPQPGDTTWWTWEPDAALVLPGRQGTSRDDP